MYRTAAISTSTMIYIVLGIIVLAVGASMLIGGADDANAATGCFSQGGQCTDTCDGNTITGEDGANLCGNTGEVCCPIV
jgi:hypothetical protein